MVHIRHFWLLQNSCSFNFISLELQSGLEGTGKVRKAGAMLSLIEKEGAVKMATFGAVIT